MRGRGVGFLISVSLFYLVIESILILYYFCNLKFDLVFIIIGNCSEIIGGYLFLKSYVFRVLVKGKCV